MRRKPRVTQLADALAAVQLAGQSLEDIDLRTTSREVRDAVRDARAQSADLVVRIADAIRADTPPPPKKRRRRGPTPTDMLGASTVLSTAIGMAAAGAVSASQLVG